MERKRKRSGTFKRMIVPLDLTPVSRYVVRAAAEISRWSGAKLVFVTVVANISPILFEGVVVSPPVTSLLEAAKKNLKRLTRGIGVPHELLVVTGNASTEIRRLAARKNADLILMGSHSKGPLTRLFVGSVSDSVAREARQAVWILKGDTSKVRRIRRILVPLDGSRGSFAAMPLAAKIAQATGGRICPASIVETKFVPNAARPFLDVARQERELVQWWMKEALRWLRRFAVPNPLAPLVSSGDPKIELPRLARRARADLIVMSTHGRTGLAGLLIGSVAIRVIHAAHCSVLVVHPKGWRYRSV